MNGRATSDKAGGLRAVSFVRGDDFGDDRDRAGATRGDGADSESDDGSSSETHDVDVLRLTEKDQERIIVN